MTLNETFFTLDEIIGEVEKWLTTGIFNPHILAKDFNFSSPFWENSNRDKFVNTFLNSNIYYEKSLVNILSFDPILRLKSDDKSFFTLVLRYHTKYGISVDEAVTGQVKDGQLIKLLSIYDLEKTKLAHRL